MRDSFEMPLTLRQWMWRVFHNSFSHDPLAFGCPAWWDWDGPGCSRIITGTARGV